MFHNILFLLQMYRMNIPGLTDPQNIQVHNNFLFNTDEYYNYRNQYKCGIQLAIRFFVLCYSS